VRDLLGRFLESPYGTPPVVISNSIGGGSFPFLDPRALMDSFSPIFFTAFRGACCLSLLDCAWKQRMYGSGLYYSAGFF
jgi:hypothetical protein